jgi:hypothetical protein
METYWWHSRPFLVAYSNVHCEMARWHWLWEDVLDISSPYICKIKCVRDLKTYPTLWHANTISAYKAHLSAEKYRGADKSLARPTSRCILFDGENISFDASLAIYRCPRRNVPEFGRVFLMLKYTDIPQNTYVQSWTVTEIMAREVWNFDSCYLLITKCILKLAGICGFCNVNICT